MADLIKKGDSILDQIIYFYEAKKRESSNPTAFLRYLLSEIGLIDELRKNNKKLVQSIINTILSYEKSNTLQETEIIEKMGGLTKGQREILENSLNNDSAKMLKVLDMLLAILIQQKDSHGTNSRDFNELLDAELSRVRELKSVIFDEGGLANKLAEKIELVKELKYSKTVKKIFNGASRLIVYPSFNVIVTGEENIPKTGPVMIASRHYHGNFDPLVFNSISQRKLFFLGAVDWTAPKVRDMLAKVYSKMGVVPINRPNSQYKFMKFGDETEESSKSTLPEAKEEIAQLLLLDQAVVIFPEGMAAVDLSGVLRKTDSLLDMQAGVFYFVDYVQKIKKVSIPILPVGLKYGEKKWPRINIELNIGKPFFIPITDTKIDYAPYAKRLKKEIESLSGIIQ